MIKCPICNEVVDFNEERHTVEVRAETDYRALMIFYAHEDCWDSFVGKLKVDYESHYKKTKDYDKTLTEKEKAYTAERDKKANDLKQLRDKISLLTDKEKESKSSDFQAKVKTFQEFVSQREGDLRKEQDERMREIMKDIQEAVKKISEKEGYTMVFNDRVLVYSDKSFDISDKVIAVLNSPKK